MQAYATLQIGHVPEHKVKKKWIKMIVTNDDDDDILFFYFLTISII